MTEETEHEMKEYLDPRKARDPSGKPRMLHREVFYAGDTIFEQDDEGYRAYYIEEGRVEVRFKEGDHTITISELGPGEIFGEMSLIEKGPRTATVRALTTTSVAIISQEELERKISSLEDKAIGALIHVLIDRLKASNKGQVHHYKNLADFQDRIAGMVDRVNVGIDESQRSAFRDDVTPLLDELEAMLDKYAR